MVGPQGELNLEYGCIIATRHIHITPAQVKEFGFEGMKTIKVKLNGPKGGIIDNVYFKEDENYFFEMHIDTDDGNGHLVNQGDICTIMTENEN